MRGVVLFAVLGFATLLISCKEKIMLNDLDLQKCSYTPTALSSFLGNHNVITLRKDSLLRISIFPQIIKQKGYFYIPTIEACAIFDANGNFVRKITYSNPLENENSWVSGYDICSVDGNQELWIASGFIEQKIHRISLEDGQKTGVIKTDYPFYKFKVIADDKIALVLANNHFLFGISDFNGKINTVGLKKKDKDIFDANVLIPYDGDYLVQYPWTTLVGYYDKKSKEIKEQLLIEDNFYVNTWQKQQELISKQGTRRGIQSSIKSYYSITHYAKNGEVELLSFTYKEKTFFSIRRGEAKFHTMEIMPNKNNYLTNDIYPRKDDFLQLSLSFEGRTDSDGSLLLYIIDDRTEALVLKERELVIIEVLN